jgi:LPXTG-motif cell wall-anchored protein
MKIPAGEHEITFKFEPEVIETGSTISLISSVLLGLLLLGGIFYGIRKKDQ